jgi:hypothetical protein
LGLLVVPINSILVEKFAYTEFLEVKRLYWGGGGVTGLETICCPLARWLRKDVFVSSPQD